MATPAPAFLEHDQVVYIYVDDNGNLLSVAPDTFEISKKKHQGVVWETIPAGHDFKVVFANSPFHYPDFTKDNPYSGEVRRQVDGDGTFYKYAVTAGTGFKDPGGHVNP